MLNLPAGGCACLCCAQAASRIAGSGNAGYVHNSGRGSLDTIGNCAGSVRSNNGGGGGSVLDTGAHAAEESMEGGGGVSFRSPVSHHLHAPRQQRPGPARCLSRTGGGMTVRRAHGSVDSSLGLSEGIGV